MGQSKQVQNKLGMVLEDCRVGEQSWVLRCLGADSRVVRAGLHTKGTTAALSERGRVLT